MVISIATELVSLTTTRLHSNRARRVSPLVHLTSDVTSTSTTHCATCHDVIKTTYLKFAHVFWVLRCLGNRAPCVSWQLISVVCVVAWQQMCLLLETPESCCIRAFAVSSVGGGWMFLRAGAVWATILHLVTIYEQTQKVVPQNLSDEP